MRARSPLLWALALAVAACSGAGGSSDSALDGSTADASAEASTADGGNGDAGLDAPDPGDGGVVRVRVVAANLTSGNSQSYDDGAGQRILEGLHPDVVMLQEFNVGGNTSGEIQAFVSSICGNGSAYVRQPGVAIPNGVASRYPIVASGVWDDPQTTDRDFVWARIDVPGPADLYAVSLHLLTKSATARGDEATSLVGFLSANVPQGSLLALAGDFNTDTRDEPAIVTLGAAVATQAPYPTDQQANENTNAPRTHPYDWVLASPSLAARAVPVSIGAQSYAAGIVIDTRVYTPIGDLAPALATDSAAKNMQHMAVVKDFEL